MKEEKDMMQKSNPNRHKVKLTFSILFLVLACIVEFYLMMNYHDNYLFMGVAALAILCITYYIVDITFQIRQEREANYFQQFENNYKAVKVTYVLIKQSFSDMRKLLEDIRDHYDIPTDELIQAQKAIGKVTIQKNKDTAASIMGANDRLREQMSDLLKELTEIGGRLDELLDQPSVAASSELAESFKEEMLKQQQDMMAAFDKSQSFMKEEIIKLSEHVDEQMHEIPDMGNAVQDILNETNMIMDSVVHKDEVQTDGETEQPVGQETLESQATEFPEEVAENGEVSQIDEGSEGEEEATQDSDSEEFSEGVEDAVAEEKPEEAEPVEIPEISSDSDKVKTPDEIAKMVGGSAASTATLAEEKLPMPDLSDPGHVMTPEEIAALLGNV